MAQGIFCQNEATTAGNSRGVMQSEVTDAGSYKHMMQDENESVDAYPGFLL